MAYLRRMRLICPNLTRFVSPTLIFNPSTHLSFPLCRRTSWAMALANFHDGLEAQLPAKKLRGNPSWDLVGNLRMPEAFDFFSYRLRFQFQGSCFVDCIATLFPLIFLCALCNRAPECSPGCAAVHLLTLMSFAPGVQTGPVLFCLVFHHEQNVS